MVTGKRMFSVTSSFSIMQAQVLEIPRPPSRSCRLFLDGAQHHNNHGSCQGSRAALSIRRRLPQRFVADQKPGRASPGLPKTVVTPNAAAAAAISAHSSGGYATAAYT